MSKYRSTWHLLPEQTYAFDYGFTLSMPSYKVTGDGDSFKEYEGTIKATGKDAKEAKEKAEKELQKRIDAAEKSTKGSLEDPFNSILDQGRAVSEGLEEFTLVHTVRYLDPKNGKRFAAPYKTKEKAQEKMAQLKRDGVKEIEITKDILRGKFKEDLDENLRYSVKFSMKKGGEIKNAFYNDKEAAEKFKNDIIKKGGKAIMTTEADLTKGQIKKVHKMADKLPKDDFKDRYGKDGDSVRYATATNMVKKKEGITEAMNPAQIKKLRDSWAQIKLMSPEKVKSLKNFLDKYSTDTLMQLAQANINFVSNMARSVASRRKVGDMKHAGSMKEDTPNERIAQLRVRQMAMQDKLRKLDVGDPKDKTPIAITKNDLENIQMKMDQLKDKARRMNEKKEHPAKMMYEKIAAIKNKAEKTGMPYSILKQVYNRGMAAWKGGHRPGTTPQQWAMARVNSFVTKSSGTWGGADSDLAKKVRSSKKN